MEKGTIPIEDRRLIISEATYLALEELAAKERRKASDIVKPMITPKSVAQHILAVAVKRGAV